MFEWAPEFHAAIIFVEHRYYGTSLPFGPDTYKDPKNLIWLTAEQALADFAIAITHIRVTFINSIQHVAIYFNDFLCIFYFSQTAT